MNNQPSLTHVFAKASLPACLLMGQLVAGAAEKRLFIPEEFKTEPALRQWSKDRSLESKNFVVYWGPTVGNSPATNPNPEMRFDPKAITGILESIYTKYITEIGFCSDAPTTNLGRYKIIIMMNDTWGPGGPAGLAFGASYDKTIGAMWVHPGATRDGGALSHELAHSLQGMISIQENKRGGGYVGWEPAGFFWECHAHPDVSEVRRRWPPGK